MRPIPSSLAAALLAAALPALAQHADHGAATGHPATTTAPSSGLTQGEVRKIDRSAGKITLRHGAIVNLDMPPMTMVFRAKDPALLDKVKEGDKVAFRAEKVDGVFIVVEMQPAS